MTRAIFSSLTVIGVGLIGSSIARAARNTFAAERIVLCDNNLAVRKFLKAQPFADSVTASVHKSVSKADCVILAAPLSAYEEILTTLAPALAPDTIVSDVGSVKTSVCQLFARALPRHVHPLPAHPIAGTEKSGARAGSALLFKDRYTVLTPLAESSPPALKRLEQFWRRLGSRVLHMEAQEHDSILALTSHLPHITAYALVLSALETHDKTLLARVSAGGFRDFTRIAASSPLMWRDVLLDNRAHVLAAIAKLRQSLTTLESAIEQGDGARLQALFSRARDARDEILAQGQAGLFLPHRRPPPNKKHGEKKHGE